MKRRMLALALCLMMVCSLLAACAQAESTDETGQGNSSGENLTWTLNSDGVLTISGTGAMKNYIITHDVPWCGSRDKIKSVIIEDGVTSIGDIAFRDCAALTSVSIPGSVSSIGSGTFYDCTALEKFEVAAENPNYCSDESGILFNKDKTKFIKVPEKLSGSYEIPDSVTGIGDGALSGCTGLTSITIPASVTSIGTSAFSGCTGLTSITIPDSVTSIGALAFYGCTSLKNITLPVGVTSIEDWTFENCTSLTSITIPNGVTSIEDWAFADCTSLTSVTIPNSVIYIDSLAFERCTSLTRVTIPESVTCIGSGAFRDCTSLTSVYFEGNAPKIYAEAFQYHKGDAGAYPIYANIPGLNFYYSDGKTGWTTPEWNGYPTVRRVGSFTDIPANAWYKEAVKYVAEHELFAGMNSTTAFVPDNAMTRAMLVTVLWRHAGEKKVEGTSKFTDVSKGIWYADAVAWAEQNGITSGDSATTFGPDKEVTREQMATFFYRYAEKNGVDVKKANDLKSFEDKDTVSGYAKKAMQWAVAEGIISGEGRNGKLYLDPQGNATRAQVAAVMMRYIEKVLK